MKTYGENTVLLNGYGANAGIYAVLRGFTDDLGPYDAEVTFVDIV